MLLFSDLHADVNATQALAERATAADVLVGAGHFGNVRRNVRVCLDVLHQAGNNESTPGTVSGARQNDVRPSSTLAVGEPRTCRKLRAEASCQVARLLSLPPRW